jgi:cysteine desulfurase
MNLDLVTLNAHKINGPKGVGALYLRQGIKIVPISHGGGQEKNRRSGTENIPGIVGFAEAVKIANSSDVKKMARLRDKLIEGLEKIPNCKLNGARGEKRLANNINFSFEGVEGEAIGGLLDAKGICTSTGSACSSKSLEPSHVLIAIGLKPEQAHGSLRLSLGKFNTEQEIDYVLEVLPKVVEKLRKISPFEKIVNKLVK